ncbi:diphthine synthase, partial [Candidatus Parvarchaeota archaeon]|nr:diphthine synthase [Candidatus Parvarchaeota archaeon]
KVFLETYTNRLDGNLGLELEEIFGVKVELLDRAQVEDEKQIIEAARKGACFLLVSGDPLLATTHVNLLISARGAGINAKIIHASSILSAAISESGLQAYKFGAATTIPHFRPNYKPSSPLEVIGANQKLGLHTILLLDVDTILGPLTPLQACNNLLEMQEVQKLQYGKAAAKKAKGRKIKWARKQTGTESNAISDKTICAVSSNTQVIVLSRLGMQGSRVIYSTIGKIAKPEKGKGGSVVAEKEKGGISAFAEKGKEGSRSFGKFGQGMCPACLVIPGKLHFVEKEFLEGLESR